MKLLKLIKLGHKNITHHKKQTILTIIIVGSLFSLLIALQFVVQGVQNIFINKEDEITSGKTYIQARNSSESYHQDLRMKNIIECEKQTGYEYSKDVNWNDNENNKINKNKEQKQEKFYNCKDEKDKKTDFWKKDQDINKINKIFNKRAKKYNGRVVSNVQYVVLKNGIEYSFYSLKTFKNLIEVDLSKAPKGSIPTIISFNKAADLINKEYSSDISNKKKREIIKYIRNNTLGKVFEEVGQKLYIVGVMHYGKDSPTLSKYEGDIKILDIILSNINEKYSFSIYINDNSQNVKDFIMSVHENFNTDMTLADAIYYGSSMVDSDIGKDIRSYTVPGESKKNGLYYYYVDKKKLETMMKEIYRKGLSGSS